jgi:peptidoglycan/LPS O-acetylase OafA/YrhL
MVLVIGSLPVNVFFILSGFIIGYLLISKDKPYRNFIIEIWFKLFPAYLVALILSLLIFDLSIESLNSIP